MAITSVIGGAVCAKMGAEVDKILGVVQGFDKMLSAQMNSIKALLSSMSFSPKSLINANAAKLLANMNKMIPNVKQFDEIAKIMSACVFLGKSPGFSPTSLLNGAVGDIKSNAMGLVRDLTGGLPEFNGAQLFNALKGQLKLGGISSGIVNINKGLGCLTAICGSDVSSKIAKLNGILGKYYLSATTGGLDAEALMKSAGLDPDKIENMMTSISSVDNITDTLDAATAAAAKRLKNMGAGSIARAASIKNSLTSFNPF